MALVPTQTLTLTLNPNTDCDFFHNFIYTTGGMDL